MCGVTGFVDLTATTSTEELSQTVLGMADTLTHRGPDGRGAWVDPTVGVALGHRRLAVIDLSVNGSQPMLSASGRYVVSFNGEIYNFRELREELAPSIGSFRGNSDTEVMLAAIDAWGIPGALHRFNGMFAFALWDRVERVLYLVRDRVGEKPIYYGWMGRTFLFGSELKGLVAHPDFRGEIERDALALYMRFKYVPAPWSIYKGINKLPPGTFLRLSIGRRRAPLSVSEYWSFHSAALAGLNDPLRATDEAATDALEDLLRQAVALRMEADVPVGAFLSGGIDSSTVVSLMQTQSSRAVKTFTIGFENSGYNEAEQALAVARHLKTDHTELYVHPQDALALIPRLAEIYDEPFADSSQIPTVLVAELARHQVTVTLSGDGGDELFGGYNRHLWGEGIWHRMGRLPTGPRKLAAQVMTSISPRMWDRAMCFLDPVLPSAFRQRTPGDKIFKLARAISSNDPATMYMGFVSHWTQPGVVIGASSQDSIASFTDRWSHSTSYTNSAMLLDSITYLPDDILTKVDRATMATGLEGRIPMLDHRLVEFAWKIPLSMKISGGESKQLLRRVLYRHVPRELIDRPKMGFGVPIDSWLRGPLREWAHDLLSTDRLSREGYFDPQLIPARLEEHLKGRRNWQYHLWDALIFQAWLEANSGRSPARQL